MRFLRFTPIYQERVWGGQGFSTYLGRTIPSAPIGESWEVCDRPEAPSVVAAGPEQGKSLRELIAQKTAWVMGPKWNPSQPFPILVKWLDAVQRLSLQVHPPAAIAPQLGGEPKTEAWYVAHAEPHAALISGLKKGVTREQFEKSLADNSAEQLVHRFSVRNGDSTFTPSGRIHAIDAGCLILEIQQNSDTTYRVYDWGRPRQLHIAESMQCIDFNDYEPSFISHSQGEVTVADCAEFRIRAFLLQPGEKLPTLPEGEPVLLGMVEGELIEADGSTIQKGDNILLPAGEKFSFTAQSPVRVLVTDHFAG